MRTHHPRRARHRFILAAVIGASTLGVGACAQPASVGAVEVPPPAATSGATSSSTPVTASAAAHSPPATGTSLPARTITAAARGCVPTRPQTDFHEGGRVATVPLTTPASSCTTISVSNIVDPANPADRCQTFLVGLWPLVNGSLTYTEPVTACGKNRTVLARNVPDKAKFIVLYGVDYIDPDVQTVKFKVWR